MKMFKDMNHEGAMTLEKRTEETDFSNVIGKEITKAVFNFVCPTTGSLVSADCFLAHGNIDPVTGDAEAIVTVACSSCHKEHPLTAISFQEMMTMPYVDPAADIESN
jgi:hypothetical protein